MRDRTQIVIWEKRHLFGLIATSYLGIRYDNKYFVTLGSNGLPQKTEESIVEKGVVSSYIVNSKVIKILKGKRFLERAIFHGKNYDKNKFLAVYLEIVKE